MSLQFELPYPPSVNHYWRRIGPRTLISREGRRFRKDVTAILAAQGVRPLSGPLVVDVQVFPPDDHRRDIDNLPKALLDALEHGGAYADDGQITQLSIVKRHAVAGGRTVVTIKELNLV